MDRYLFPKIKETKSIDKQTGIYNLLVVSCQSELTPNFDFWGLKAGVAVK